MKLVFSTLFKIGALGLGLLFAACSSFSHSYMSPEDRQAHGQRLMQEAVQQSDVVSVLTSGGGVVVLTDIRIGSSEYCAVLRSVWSRMSYREGWSDRNPSRRSTCTSYHGIVDVRAKDMRNCQGSECLWLRGL